MLAPAPSGFCGATRLGDGDVVGGEAVGQHQPQVLSPNEPISVDVEDIKEEVSPVLGVLRVLDLAKIQRQGRHKFLRIIGRQCPGAVGRKQKTSQQHALNYIAI